jgi:hypothetical protein
MPKITALADINRFVFIESTVLDFMLSLHIAWPVVHLYE